MTCFHANTELRHRGVTYTWALAASCSFKRSVVDRSTSPKNLKQNVEAEFFSRERREAGELLPQPGEEDDVSLDLDNGFDSVRYLVGEDGGGGRLTDQLSGSGGGKHSPAAFGSVASGREGGGNRTLAARQKKLFCSDKQLITWRAVVPWQEISPKKKKTTTKEPLCFLSDQEDVLRDGWSVELEAVQARV